MKIKNIKVELTEDQIESINIILNRERYLESDKISMNELVTMLLSDVANVIDRPGSWEGNNMVQVLRGHGWKV